MFQSVAQVVLALLALLVKPADASFDGPPITYNIYGGGLDPCQDANLANITMTGATTKLFRLDTAVEEDALCEHDVLNLPDGTTMTVYTKTQKIECTADVMEMTAYNCVDEACQNCSASMEMDAFVTTRNIQAVLEDPFECFAMLNATDNVTASGATSEFFNIESLSAQRFLENENQETVVAEYWNYVFQTSCGDEWLVEVTASTAPMVKYGSHILGSVVLAAMAMVVPIVVVV